MAGNGYDNGHPGGHRRGADAGWAEQYGPSGGQQIPPGAPTAPPPGAFGTYRGTGPGGPAPYGAPQGRGGHDPYGAGPGGAAPYPPQAPGGPDHAGDPYPGGPGYDPYADNPGHTRAFTVPEGLPQSGAVPGQGQQYDDYDDGRVATYRASGNTGPHEQGPPLEWRELLSGMYLNPSRTFDRMRDHQPWLPALTVTAVYGILAVLGFGDTRESVLHSTFSVAAWTLLGSILAFALASAALGAVTHSLARQLGGDGIWQATVGLSTLVAWTTDAPRVLFALFMPADSAFVQVLGWATWLLCAGLMATMVRRVHDLPWGKAIGAASIQLVVLLILIKLPTLS